MLWGLGVGYVISGMYFGWNLGLPLGGTWGMLAATIVVTILYVDASSSATRSSRAPSRAPAAPSTSACAPSGRRAACVLGVAQIVEFLFAPPAIAVAIGAYFNLFFPAASPEAIAIAAYVVFTGAQRLGRQAGGRLRAGRHRRGRRRAPAVHGRDRAALPARRTSRVDALPARLGRRVRLPAVRGLVLPRHRGRRERRRGGAQPAARRRASASASAMLTLVVLALGVFFTSVGVAGWARRRLPDARRAPVGQPAAARARAHRGRPAARSTTCSSRSGLLGPGRVVPRHRARRRARGARARARGLRARAPSAASTRAPGRPRAALAANAVIGDRAPSSRAAPPS